MIARLDHPDAREANAQALDDLASGADGLQVVFAGARRRLWLRAEAIRSGDFASRRSKACASTPARASSSISAATAPAQAQSFAALVERSGAPARRLRRRRSASIRSRAGARAGRFPPIGTAHVEAAVSTRRLHCDARGFAGPFVVADARAVHAAGGTPSQELAFALGAGVAYLRALNAAGVPLDEARARDRVSPRRRRRRIRHAGRNSARCACCGRGSRRPAGLTPRPARVQAESAWRMMTARDPYVNVMRGAIAAFSAGLGGADSVSVLPHTLAARPARQPRAAPRAQRPAHPAARIPSRLRRRSRRRRRRLRGADRKRSATRAWALFQEIEGEGGLPAALASGAFQRRGRRERGGAARATSRGASRRSPASARIADLGRGPRRRRAGRAGARTAGARPTGALAPMRLAEPFERLRDASDAMLLDDGARPKVFLVALGPSPSHRRRVAFVREWLEAGGVRAGLRRRGRDARRGGRRASRRSGAALACLCGDDEAYAAQAAAFAAALKAAGVKGLILAGPSRGRRGGACAPRASTISSSPAATRSRRCRVLYRRASRVTQRAGRDDDHEPDPRFLANAVSPPRRTRRRRAGEARVWTTPEGIDVKSLYGPRRSRRARFLARLARAPALSARALSDHVRQSALDGAPIRRLLDRRGVERLLSRQSGRRPEGPLGRLRSGDPSRLRFRSSARRRRRRHGGRRDRLDL